MTHKITPQLEYPLNDYQLEALSRLAEWLPDMETVTGIWRAEAYAIGDLPFTSKEHTPFCRNVRVWDAKGFSPAVELCNRHPDLLVADDWLRATTFDLYCMAMKTAQSFVADWNITHIIAIHGWVKYLKEVQTYEFMDTVAPANVYHGHRLADDTKALFQRHSNDDSPKRQYIKFLINWRTRSGRH